MPPYLYKIGHVLEPRSRIGYPNWPRSGPCLACGQIQVVVSAANNVTQLQYICPLDSYRVQRGASETPPRYAT
jgi:hypothetical protein